MAPPRHPTLLDRAGDAATWAATLPHRLTRPFGHAERPAPTPLDHFLAETPHSAHGLWLAYDRLLRRAARERRRVRPSAPKPSAAPPDPAASWWEAWYARADALAVLHASRSRSVTALVPIIAAAAVALGGVGDVLAGLDGLPPWPARAALALQSLAILAIALLVTVARTGAWQERAVERRLLAELCHIQAAMAPLGRDLPLTVVATGGSSALAWLFAALQRAAPRPSGYLGGARVAVAPEGLSRGLIGGQIHWHRARRRRMHRAGALLLHSGEALFFAVTAVIAGKLWLGPAVWGHGWGLGLGWLTTTLPAIAAAALGLRKYAETELLARQSERMILRLRAARHRLDAVDIAAPLASERLGAEALRAADLMLRETAGWAELFELKAAETG